MLLGVVIGSILNSHDISFPLDLSWFSRNLLHFCRCFFWQLSCCSFSRILSFCNLQTWIFLSLLSLNREDGQYWEGNGGSLCWMFTPLLSIKSYDLLLFLSLCLKVGLACKTTYTSHFFLFAVLSWFCFRSYGACVLLPFITALIYSKIPLLFQWQFFLQ